jgi:hypothetical protein
MNYIISGKKDLTNATVRHMAKSGDKLELGTKK